MNLRKLFFFFFQKPDQEPGNLFKRKSVNISQHKGAMIAGRSPNQIWSPTLELALFANASTTELQTRLV